MILSILEQKLQRSELKQERDGIFLRALVIFVKSFYPTYDRIIILHNYGNHIVELWLNYVGLFFVHNNLFIKVMLSKFP